MRRGSELFYGFGSPRYNEQSVKLIQGYEILQSHPGWFMGDVERKPNEAHTFLMECSLPSVGAGVMTVCHGGCCTKTWENRVLESKTPIPPFYFSAACFFVAQVLVMLCFPVFSYAGVIGTASGMVDLKDMKPLLNRLRPSSREMMVRA